MPSKRLRNLTLNSVFDGTLSVAVDKAGQDEVQRMLLSAIPGTVIQIVNVQDGAVATGTTLIPFDDTIPQITEGDEYITLAITPADAANRLLILVTVQYGTSGADFIQTALFQDAIANALATVSVFLNGANHPTPQTFAHNMVAGTTSSTTFRVRIGKNGAGTITFNGAAAGRRFGGTSASSITIIEYTP